MFPQWVLMPKDYMFELNFMGWRHGIAKKRLTESPAARSMNFANCYARCGEMNVCVQKKVSPALSHPLFLFSYCLCVFILWSRREHGWLIKGAIKPMHVRGRLACFSTFRAACSASSSQLPLKLLTRKESSFYRSAHFQADFLNSRFSCHILHNIWWKLSVMHRWSFASLFLLCHAVYPKSFFHACYRTCPEMTS